MNILEQLQKEFKNNVWKPEHLTMVDSDPRWRAIDIIEKETGIKLDWCWKDTDFTEIGCEPLVVEFSSTKDDEIKFIRGKNIIQKIIKDTEYQAIIGNKLVVIIKIKK